MKKRNYTFKDKNEIRWRIENGKAISEVDDIVNEFEVWDLDSIEIKSDKEVAINE